VIEQNEACFFLPGEYQTRKKSAQRYQMLTYDRIVMLDAYVIEIFLENVECGL
jgi:hypothetical protein